MWLAPVIIRDQLKGRCTLCNSEFSTTAGCESAIRSHTRGTIHIKLVRAKEQASRSISTLFFHRIKASNSVSASVASTSTASTSLDLSNSYQSK